jgi:type I restriction enzyme S subunit
MPRGDKEALSRFGFQLPPLNEQLSITEVLDALEDQIVLLRESNKTLESIAQAIFKSWFVDFDPVTAKAAGLVPGGIDEATAALFPDSFDASPLGQMPKGWSISTIEEIAHRVGMGPFGSNIKVETFVDSGIPVISGQHLKQLLIEDGAFNFITVDHARKLSNSCVQRGDVIFTHAGNIGQVALLAEGSLYDRYVLSQRQFFLRCDQEAMCPEWITYYFRSTQGQHQLLANASQVGVPSIARPVTYLKSIRFLKPPMQLIKRFSEISDVLNKSVMANRSEIKTLSELRDTLLPRLISGKLRIPETTQEAVEMA